MLEKLLRTRRSIRNFRPDPVYKETIEKLIEMASTAPSTSNEQPWRFFATDRQTRIQHLASIVADMVPDEYRHSKDELAPGLHNFCQNLSGFKQAQTLIIPIFRSINLFSEMPVQKVFPEQEDMFQRVAYQCGLISVSLAIQNLLVYAHHVGLGACVMTGPLLVSDKVKSCLEIPHGWEIAAFIPMGYPCETPSIPQRKPIRDILHWI